MTRRVRVSVEEYVCMTWFASSARTIPVSRQPIHNGEKYTPDGCPGISRTTVRKTTYCDQQRGALLRQAALPPLLLGLGAAQSLLAPSMAWTIALTAAPGARPPSRASVFQ